MPLPNQLTPMQAFANLHKTSTKPEYTDSPYSPDFLEFAGKALDKIKFSTDMTSVNAVAEAIKAGDWQSPALAIDPNAYRAMAKHASIFKTPNEVELANLPFFSRKTMKTLAVTVPPFLTIKYFSDSLSIDQKIVLSFYLYESKLLTKDNLELLAEHFKFKEVLSYNNFLALFDENNELTEIAHQLLEKVQKKLGVKLWEIEELWDLTNNKKSLEQLLATISQTIHELPFSEHLVHAITAFSKGLIQRDHMETLLMRHELVWHYGKVSIIPILDKNNQLNQELIECANKMKRNILTDETQTRFKENISEVSALESVIFKIDSENYWSKDERLYGYPSLFFHQADDESYVLILPPGLVDALGVAINGPEQHSKSKVQLDVMTRKDISYYVNRNERPCATYFPNTTPTIFVHNELDSIWHSGFYHDKGHLVLMSGQPIIARKLFQRINNLINAISGEEWTLETWNLTDRAFDFSNTADDPQELYRLMIISLFPYQQIYYTENYNLYVNSVLSIFAIDLEFNVDWYQENGFDISLFKEHSDFFHFAKYAEQIKPNIEKDTFILRVMKLAYYSAFCLKNIIMTPQENQELFTLLEKYHQQNRLRIDKNPEKNYLQITGLHTISLNSMLSFKDNLSAVEKTLNSIVPKPPKGTVANSPAILFTNHHGTASQLQKPEPLPISNAM